MWEGERKREREEMMGEQRPKRDNSGREGNNRSIMENHPFVIMLNF